MEKRFWITAFLILAFDQFTKIFVLRTKPAFNIFNFLEIKLATNTGAAFGILQNQSTALAWLSVIVIGVVLFLYDRINKSNDMAAGLILGGVLGNLIDRISYSYVVDFIGFSFFPSFNVADAALTIGVLWLAFYVLKKDITFS